MAWRSAVSADTIGDDEIVGLKIDGRDIAVCRHDGTYYAFHNICTHEYACMSDGFVDGDQIECPLHQARFDIRTGKALTAPAEVDLRTYPTKVEADQVYVGMPKT